MRRTTSVSIGSTPIRASRRCLTTKRTSWASTISSTHQIFDSFFKIDLSILARCTGQCYRGVPQYMAIYQDNDPKKRIIAVVNAANDIGEYWEYSDQGFSPVPDNEAYKLGVNYLIYAADLRLVLQNRPEHSRAMHGPVLSRCAAVHGHLPGQRSQEAHHRRRECGERHR